MLKVLESMYSGDVIVSVLTIGAWAGVVVGIVVASMLTRKHLRLDHVYTVNSARHMSRVLGSAILCAAAVIIVVAGGAIGTVVGIMAFVLVWFALLPCLLVGAIVLTVLQTRRIRRAYAIAASCNSEIKHTDCA